MAMPKLILPEWMNEKFQKTCIKNSESFQEDDIKIKNVGVEYAIPLGQNYMSTIYNLMVDFSLKNSEVNHRRSFAVKINLEIEDIAALEADSQMFSRELNMYGNVLPTLQKVLDEGGVQKRLACKCVYSSTTPFIMAMENLKVDGYEMADKYIGLDLEHCKMTLERLAMLHGASMRYYTMKKTIPEKSLYFTPMIRDSELRRQIFSNACSKQVESVISILETKGEYKSVVQYLLKNIGDDAFKWYCDHFEYKRGNKFNALLHGDAWISNAMYKYDENRKLKDVMLLDYQISNYASVANDFLFFFFSSANDDVREHHFTTLIAYYHECLVNVLKRLGYTEDIPTVEDFKTELKRACGCGLMTLFSMLPSMRTKIPSAYEENCNGLSMEEHLQLAQVYSNSPEYQKTLFFGINSLMAEGYFD